MQIEITRRNVTVKEFIRYINKRCDEKGTSSGIDEQFIDPQYPRNTAYDSDDESETPCQSEIIKTLPYDYHIACVYWNGTKFNEICEFTFDTDTKGTGYYYLEDTVE